MHQEAIISKVMYTFFIWEGHYTNFTTLGRDCKQNYLDIENKCPKNFFDIDYDASDVDCPRVSEECKAAIKKMEGWYCSCRTTHDGDNSEPGGDSDTSSFVLI